MLQVSVVVVGLLSCVLVSQVEASFMENLSELAPKENYDAFFNMVDRFLWDSEDAEERQFRRGFSDNCFFQITRGNFGTF